MFSSRGYLPALFGILFPYQSKHHLRRQVPMNFPDSRRKPGSFRGAGEALAPVPYSVSVQGILVTRMRFLSSGDKALVNDLR